MIDNILWIAARWQHNPKVQEFMLDFESVMWHATESVFLEVTINGCSFHWNQAVWRKVQNLGLQEAYMNHGDTHNFIRCLMAIPFLPSEHITPVSTTSAERLVHNLFRTKLIM